jgi:hypothetical protein
MDFISPITRTLNSNKGANTGQSSDEILIEFNPERCEIEIYLNVIAAQTLTRNDIRNLEIIMELNRRIRVYIDF